MEMEISTEEMDTCLGITDDYSGDRGAGEEERLEVTAECLLLPSSIVSRDKHLQPSTPKRHLNSSGMCIHYPSDVLEQSPPTLRKKEVSVFLHLSIPLFSYRGGDASLRSLPRSGGDRLLPTVALFIISGVIEEACTESEKNLFYFTLNGEGCLCNTLH